MKKLLLILFSLTLLSFSPGIYDVVDLKGNQTVFCFKSNGTGYYYRYKHIGEYHYFNWSIKRDLVTLIYKDRDIYYGTQTYRVVGDKFIEQYASHTLIFLKIL